MSAAERDDIALEIRHLCSDLRKGDANERCAALEELGALLCTLTTHECDAEQELAVQALCAALGDPAEEVCRHAFDWVPWQQLGPAVVPALVEELERRRDYSGVRVARVLAQLAPGDVSRYEHRLVASYAHCQAQSDSMAETNLRVCLAEVFAGWNCSAATVAVVARDLESQSHKLQAVVASVLAKAAPSDERTGSVLRSLLAHPAPDVRCSVVMALGAILQSGGEETALPLLVQLLRDEHPDVREAIQRTLHNARTESVERALCQALADPLPAVRTVAVRYFVESGPQTRQWSLLFREELGVRLANLCSDAEPAIRQDAAQCLGQIHPLSPAAASRMVTIVLTTADERVRERVAHALRFEPEALRAAVPEIAVALSSTEEAETLTRSLRLLSDTQKPNSELAVLAEPFLTHPAASVRAAAMAPLVANAVDLELARRACEAGLNDSQPVVCQAALRGCMRLRADGFRLQPAIARFLRPSEGLCELALATIKQLGSLHETARDALVTLARDSSVGEKLQIEVLMLLAADPASREFAVAELIRLLETSGNIPLLCRALIPHGKHAAAAVPRLVNHLEFGIGEEERDICFLLHAIGPPAAPAIPHLIPALRQRDDVASGAALTALAGIGAASVPHLRPLLQAKSGRTREWAADALGRIGPAAVEVAPDLQVLLDNPHPGTACWAAISLARINQDPVAYERLIDYARAPANCPSPVDVIRVLPLYRNHRATTLDALVSLAAAEPHRASFLEPIIAELRREAEPR